MPDLAKSRENRKLSRFVCAVFHNILGKYQPWLRNYEPEENKEIFSFWIYLYLSKHETQSFRKYVKERHKQACIFETLFGFLLKKTQFYGISLMTFISQLKISFVSRNEASLQELEIRFQLVITTQIWSLFLRSKTSFLKSKLRFRNQTFVPGIETSFSQLKLRFSEQRFELSRNKQLETKLRMWIDFSSCKWSYHSENRRVDWKTEASILETKLRT